MNPWSGAEPGSEATERDLFARRARALEPAAIPSLASVLRAARANAPEARENQSGETRAARGAQSRAFVALALAAACMAAAVTKLPTATHASIAADFDAAAPSVESAPAIASPPTCELHDEVLMSEERACFPPAPLFTAAPKSAPASASPSLACTANESCSMSITP